MQRNFGLVFAINCLCLFLFASLVFFAIDSKYSQIAEARDKGDLSENAEYDAAKEAQGMLEAKIAQLKAQIADAKIIDESKIDTSTVQILTKVKLRNTKNNATMVYSIVPESEADLKAGKISSSTPIAKGLLGHKVGETVEIQIPSGKIGFEILEISL